jgi:stress-induced-phosphoprotein 1
MSEAEEAKGRGNAAFAKGEFELSVTEFTAAIELDPKNHVYYSNRSGAYASMQRFDEALKDAELCVEAKPDWGKGYSRKGLALYKLDKLDEAKEAYEAGLKVEPSNAACKTGIKDIEKSNSNPMGALFGPAMWGKLQADPTTAEYLKDPAFVTQMRNLQSNPNMMSSAMGGDPRLSAAMGVILGLGSSGFSSMNAGEGDEDGDAPMRPAASSKPAASKPKAAPVVVEEEEEDAELAAEKRVRAEALAAKEKGNTHYKKREFEAALVCYDEAIEKDPENLAFVLNKAAVYYEQKAYDACVETCDSIIKDEMAKKGYDFQLVSKALYRSGNALAKQGNLDAAHDAYGKALMEYPLPAAQVAIKKIAEQKKKADAAAYLSTEKSEEHKVKGNELFTEGKWIPALEEYSESLKRDPTNYRVYSNRAACYTKLMDWTRGLEDCNKCLEIDPLFVKAYIRKAKIQHVLKHYHKALETFEKGIKIDPKNPELLQGRQQTMNAINQENADGNVDPARAQEAMKDPEIQVRSRLHKISFLLLPRILSCPLRPSIASLILSPPRLPCTHTHNTPQTFLLPPSFSLLRTARLHFLTPLDPLRRSCKTPPSTKFCRTCRTTRRAANARSRTQQSWPRFRSSLTLVSCKSAASERGVCSAVHVPALDYLV